MAAQMALYGGLAALQLTGGYFASQNIKATARLNQEIADMNAQFAELDAYDALLEGESEKARYQSVIDSVLGEQQAIMEAQGVDTSFGSAASISEETKFTAELNLMEIEKQAQERALGYKRQARDLRTSGAMTRAQGDIEAGATRFTSALGAAQTGLTGYRRSQ